MKITATANFKHGRFAFAKGAAYDVPDRFAGLFLGNGWAIEAGDDAPCMPVGIAELGANAPVGALPSVDRATLTVESVNHAGANSNAG